MSINMLKEQLDKYNPDWPYEWASQQALRGALKTGMTKPMARRFLAESCEPMLVAVVHALEMLKVRESGR